MLVAAFPWLFSYQGVVFGQPISIRALGDAMGILIAMAGVLMFVSESFRGTCQELALSLDQLPFSTQRQLILAGTAVYVLGVISHKLRAHCMLGTHALDLGFFSNICWNTSQGMWFYSSLLERNFMGVHANWILWPLSFLYRFFQGAEVLLVTQAVLTAAAVPILWRTAQKIIGSFVGGFFASFLFVSSPYIGHTVSNDFHPDIWQLPSLLAALAAWQNKKPLSLLVWSLLALMAKEDVSVVLCGFGLFLVFQKEWRITGLALFSASIGVFIFHTHFFIPQFLAGDKKSLLFYRYFYLGRNFGEMEKNLFHDPALYVVALLYEPTKYWRFPCYFFPVAGLTFFAPLFLVPPIISVMPHLLSQSSTQLSLADIYSLPSQPFIFVGAAIGAKRLLDRFGTKIVFPLAGVLLMVAGVGAFKSPKYYKSETPERIRAFHEMQALIPRDAPLAAQQDLYPHFDTRRFIQLFPLGNSMPPLQTMYLKNPSYIACDHMGNAIPYNGDDLAGAISALEINSGYEKIFERENFVLFRRIKNEKMRWRSIVAPKTS